MTAIQVISSTQRIVVDPATALAVIVNPASNSEISVSAPMVNEVIVNPPSTVSVEVAPANGNGIVVNPATRSIGVVNAGPMGPTGPVGPPSVPLPTELELLEMIKTVDGPGSGLNADLLDGISASGFVQVGATAGGVLAGTYPNPTFAVDMATQAELDAAIAGLPGGGGGVTAVNSVSGTANQISASPTTGAVVLSLPSAVTMPGSLVVTTTLGVTGATTLNSTLGVTGGATFSSTLSAGASTLASLSVTGAATIGTTLGVTGAVTLSSTLSAGASTLNSLAVTNAATIGTTLTVTGAVTLNSSLTVAGDLIVNGTTTTVNSNTVTIDDPIFTLGGDTAPGSDDNKDRGIEFRWYSGSAKVGFFGFDDSTGKFTFIPDATNASEVFSGAKGGIDVGTIDASSINATGTLVVSGVTTLNTGLALGTVAATPVNGTIRCVEEITWIAVMRSPPL